MRLWQFSRIAGLCAAAAMVSLSSVQAGELEEWFEKQCTMETMSRNKAAGYKSVLPTDDQDEACRAEAYLSAETFRTADNEKKIDLMMRACLRNKGALYAVMFGPTAARQEMVKQMALDQCRKEVAETYRKVK